MNDIGSGEGVMLAGKTLESSSSSEAWDEGLCNLGTRAEGRNE